MSFLSYALYEQNSTSILLYTSINQLCCASEAKYEGFSSNLQEKCEDFQLLARSVQCPSRTVTTERNSARKPKGKRPDRLRSVAALISQKSAWRSRQVKSPPPTQVGKATRSARPPFRHLSPPFPPTRSNPLCPSLPLRRISFLPLRNFEILHLSLSVL